MNNYYKYIKYKTKYNNINGGSFNPILPSLPSRQKKNYKSFTELPNQEIKIYESSRPTYDEELARKLANYKIKLINLIKLLNLESQLILNQKYIFSRLIESAILTNENSLTLYINITLLDTYLKEIKGFIKDIENILNSKYIFNNENKSIYIKINSFQLTLLDYISNITIIDMLNNEINRLSQEINQEINQEIKEEINGLIQEFDALEISILDCIELTNKLLKIQLPSTEYPLTHYFRRFLRR